MLGLKLLEKAAELRVKQAAAAAAADGYTVTGEADAAMDAAWIAAAPVPTPRRPRTSPRLTASATS